MSALPVVAAPARVAETSAVPDNWRELLPPRRYSPPRTGMGEDLLLRGFDRHCPGCAGCAPAATASPHVAAACTAAGES